MANTGNTQQIIDYGTTANDGTGDPLRTAFIKTDENFSNIWLAGPVGSNITIANNTIQNDSTNGNIIIKPNGVGVIQANAAIVPSAANVRDIGTSALPFRAGYFGVGGLRVDGNVTVTGNLSAGNISYTGNVFVGDLQGSVFADDSTIMVDAIDNAMYADTGVFGTLSATGNITAGYFLGNGSQLTGITSYANANAVSYGEAGWAGNIIPSANLTYSLGNSTNWWSNIWVASNTIYIGGVALGITGNVLTVDGEAVLSNDSNSSITTTGNLSADWVNADTAIKLGNLSELNSSAFIAGGGQSATLASQDEGVTIAANLLGDTKTWSFQPSGAMTAPGNISAGNLIASSEVIAAGRITGQYFEYADGIGQLGYSGNVPFLYGTEGVQIQVADGEAGPFWLFDTAGDLTAPGNIAAGNIITNGISSDDSTFVTVQDGLNVAGDIESSGNVTAANFIGNVAAANVVGLNYVAGSPYVLANANTLIWTASSADVIGGKISIKIERTSGNICTEFLDVTLAMEYNAGNVSYVVSDLLKTNNSANNSQILVETNVGNTLVLYTTVADGDDGYVTYKVTEFQKSI